MAIHSHTFLGRNDNSSQLVNKLYTLRESRRGTCRQVARNSAPELFRATMKTIWNLESSANKYFVGGWNQKETGRQCWLCCQLSDHRFQLGKFIYIVLLILAEILGWPYFCQHESKGPKILLKSFKNAPKSLPNPPKIDLRWHQKLSWGLCWTPHRKSLHFSRPKNGPETPMSSQKRSKYIEILRKFQFLVMFFVDLILQAILVWFSRLQTWKMLLPSRQNTNFWETDVLENSSKNHEFGNHFREKKPSKNTKNMEIGWIGWATACGTWKTMQKTPFGGGNSNPRKV